MPGDTCDRLSSHVQKQQYEQNIVQKHNSGFEVKKVPLILRAVLCAMTNWPRLIVAKGKSFLRQHVTSTKYLGNSTIAIVP